MPKELPYFKFEPLEWGNGNIQMCSFQSKGVFIEMCSLYWSRAGELPYALALQKLCNGDAQLMQELKHHDIFTVNEDQIIIDFLDEQLSQFQETSVKRVAAANKRWQNASAMQMHSKSNAIREDKIREDKIKEKPHIVPLSDFLAYAIENKPNVCKQAVELKYKAWSANGWKDGNNKPVKNWKTKLLNTLPFMAEVKNPKSHLKIDL